MASHWFPGNGKHLSDPFSGVCVWVWPHWPGVWSHWPQMDKQTRARQMTACRQQQVTAHWRTTTCSILHLRRLLLLLLLLLLILLPPAPPLLRNLFVASQSTRSHQRQSTMCQRAVQVGGGYAIQRAACSNPAYPAWEAATCQGVALAT